MKTLGSVILIIISTFILPLAVYSADANKVKEVVGIIIEKSETGSFIQVGDYSISGIGKVVIKEGGKADKTGKTEDLFIGALVAVNLTEKDENGIWGASGVALLLGGNQAQALAKVSKDEKNSILETQKAVTGKAEEVAAEADEVKSPSPSDGKLRLENGVWVN